MPDRKSKDAHYYSRTCEEPMVLHWFDYIGPIPTSANGNRYILTIRDYFTKWVEAVPLPTKHAPVTAGALFKASSTLLILQDSLILCMDNYTLQIFMRIGNPRVVMSQQGSEFQNSFKQTIVILVEDSSPFHNSPSPSGQIISIACVTIKKKRFDYS